MGTRVGFMSHQNLPVLAHCCLRSGLSCLFPLSEAPNQSCVLPFFPPPSSSSGHPAFYWDSFINSAPGACWLLLRNQIGPVVQTGYILKSHRTWKSVFSVTSLWLLLSHRTCCGTGSSSTLKDEHPSRIDVLAYMLRIKECHFTYTPGFLVLRTQAQTTEHRKWG